MTWIDKEKCVGCGACVDVCPEGFEMKDGKSIVIHPDAPCIDEAASLCPVGAIKADAERGTIGQIQSKGPPEVPGAGRGMGKGRGKGLGRGPRDGRGQGRGGGGGRRSR